MCEAVLPFIDTLILYYDFQIKVNSLWNFKIPYHMLVLLDNLVGQVPMKMYCLTVNWQKATSFKIWNRISKNLFFCFPVLSLKEIACRCIVANTTIYGIDRLPLPHSLTSHLKSYALTNKTRVRMQSFVHRKIKYLNPTDTPPAHCRQSCCIS